MVKKRKAQEEKGTQLLNEAPAGNADDRLNASKLSTAGWKRSSQTGQQIDGANEDNAENVHADGAAESP